MTLPRRPGPSRRVRVREITGAVARDHEDRLATEEPLEIRLAWPGRPADRLNVTMRTPGHDFELASGFLFGEGIVASASDLRTVAYCTDRSLAPEQEFNVVTVELAGPARRTPSLRYDGPGAGSACGVCGKQSIDDVLALGRDVDLNESWAGLVLPHDVLSGLPGTLREAQRVFASTGGLHAAGLFHEDGTPAVVREDIGRHNAVDKVVGAQLLAGAATALPVLCVSGRIGFELVQKAVAAGVGVIAAVGAPSSLAVSLAAEAGLCTVGFLREDRCVVYTAPERIGV
ncbi:MAG TPA: formate dehydrogenase accessory sulfurtransferase FdhD [Nocardioidaceae bacterium]|nr:formate dehydrogenase accessory sulfurtransferase FdhD [Nocardioidaceae bacterium]